jgi:hypothetical protein
MDESDAKDGGDNEPAPAQMHFNPFIPDTT